MAEQTYQVVNVPNVGKVRFPTSMDDAAVLDAVKKLSNDAPLSPEQRKQMAAHPEGGPSEPGTFWGGFLKSIKDQLSPGFSGDNQMLQKAAHPETLSDFLSLIIPSEFEEAGRPIIHMLKSGAEQAKRGGTGVMATAGNFVKGAHNWAFPTDPHLTMGGPSGFSRWTTGAKPKAGYFGPAQDAAEGVDAVGQAGVNELPAYLQQQLMDEGGSQASAASGSNRVGTAPYQPSPQAPELPRQMPPLSIEGRGGSMPPLVPTAAEAGRHVGKAPTLADELFKILDEAKQGEKPPMSTGAPDLTSTAGGPLHQSGKFGKSGNLGQAGGYSSGNPATGAPDTAMSLEEILAPDTELQDITRNMSEKPPGGGGGTITGPGPEIDTRNWTTRDWADLRRQKGARDAGRLTGKTPDEVRELSGGGPSQTPLEAEERIRNAANRARGEE